MSVRRVGVLLGKEFVRGSKSFMFIFAILVPLVVTLVVSLLFGSLLSGKPTLGVADRGDSRFGSLAEDVDSILVRTYSTPDALRDAVRAGTVDVGVTVPVNFDGVVQEGERAQLTAYVWGESLLKDRIVLGSTIASLVRQVAGQDAPVEIVTATLGDGENIPWDKRIMPFIVLMSIILGGTMIPATSLVDEKVKRTLTAITVTPLTAGEVYLAKGLVGFIISFFIGIFTLLLNSAFGEQEGLLILIMALSAAMSATFGVLLGVMMKDINTLFATIKGTGILLYAPAIIYLFPSIPAWVGRIFPTFYMIDPIVEVTQRGGSWADVVPELAILVALIAGLMLLVTVVSRRRQLVPA